MSELDESLLGREIEILTTKGNVQRVKFRGVVKSFDDKTRKYILKLEDGRKGRVDLSKATFRFVDQQPAETSQASVPADQHNTTTVMTVDNAADTPTVESPAPGLHPSSAEGPAHTTSSHTMSSTPQAANSQAVEHQQTETASELEATPSTAEVRADEADGSANTVQPELTLAALAVGNDGARAMEEYPHDTEQNKHQEVVAVHANERGDGVGDEEPISAIAAQDAPHAEPIVETQPSGDDGDGAIQSPAMPPGTVSSSSPGTPVPAPAATDSQDTDLFDMDDGPDPEPFLDSSAYLDLRGKLLDNTNALVPSEDSTLGAFDAVTKPEEVLVGVLGEDEIQEHDAALESAKLAAERKRQLERVQWEAQLHEQERRARQRVLQAENAATTRLRKKDAVLEHDITAKQAAIHRTFRKANAELNASLAAQQAVVQERYGTLQAESAGKREWKVEWAKMPQPVEFNVSRMRAVKSKLPSGRYVLLATLYDRLGGQPLRWSQLGTGTGIDSNRSAATRAVRHRGRYYDTDFIWQEKLFALCPSKPDIRPSHVFVLELFLLGGARNPIDRVVAWTALPACDADFRAVEGKFCLPMLRGEVDFDVDRYRTFEARLCDDLDHWLANLYIEVSHLPRSFIDSDGTQRGEYDVQMAFTSELLRIRQSNATDGEAAEAEADSDWETDEEDENVRRGGLAIAATRLRASKTARLGDHPTVDPAAGNAPNADLSVAHAAEFQVDRGAVGLNKPAGLAALADYSYAVTRQQTRGLLGHRVAESRRKFRYLNHELLSDLSFGGFRTFEFWINLLLLIVALYLRVYMHYLSQWLFLRSLRVPVYEFTPTPYDVTLKYVGEVLPAEYELGVVIIGQLGNITAFAAFVLVSWLSQRVIRTFPAMLSKFVSYFGLASLLDALLIFVVDVTAQKYDCGAIAACRQDPADAACDCTTGDAFKLYYRFRRDEGSGVVGVVLTVFIYIVLALMAAFVLYAFLLHLHMDGRMLDVYRRLHALETEFFVPHDFEVSAAELQWVCAKAARWRGPKGSLRKVAVCDYVLTDPLDPKFREVTTHLVIYHATVDGKREMYRHFLRLPDGTIMELFGDLRDNFGMNVSALLSQAPAEDETANIFRELMESVR